jgi:hypothetical protein
MGRRIRKLIHGKGDSSVFVEVSVVVSNMVVGI